MSEKQPGFYGKLPILGDFVFRRLPQQFITPWDQWLQSGIAASREQLDAEWLEIYLTSPIWRFGLSSGLCGPGAWAGIVMPSVDRVGRYFPLTIASAVGNAENLLPLFEQGPAWFEKLERLALTGLEDGLDLADFDRELSGLELPEFAGSFSAPGPCPGGDPPKFAVCMALDGAGRIPSALASLGGLLLDRFVPGYSIWGTRGSERVPASLLVCEGLPPIEAFSALMTGGWQHRGWTMNFKKLFGFATGTVAGEQRTTEAEAARSPAGEAEPTAAAPWQSHGISVAGNRRSKNEDAFIERNDLGLWAVADGMGGHSAGEVASGAIVGALDRLNRSASFDAMIDRALLELSQANRDIRRYASEHLAGQTVGSTVVLLIARGSECAAIWAGDSRLYRCRDGGLLQLTWDHSLAADWPESGLPEGGHAAEVAHPNVITRAVGAEPELELETLRFEAAEGDVFLLCSDGLVKELDAAEIAALLQGQTCEASARALVDAALARDGRDNITVVVVRPEPTGREPM